MTYRPEEYPRPLPQPTFAPQEDVEEEELVEEEERPELDEDDPNYIPELELDDETSDEIFGTGEKLDGSLDETERTDIDDVLEIGDTDSIFGTGDPKPKPKRFKRTVKRFAPQPPPSNMGGLQF